jgi:hypothetical protein
MQPRFHVSLRVIDDEYTDLPEEITNQTGISPSETWRKGEVKLGTAIQYKDNGWELKSGLPLEASLVDHVNFLLSAVEPARKQLMSLTKKYYSVLACAVYFGEEHPEIYLDNNLLRQIADMNLRLDLDIYCIE